MFTTIFCIAIFCYAIFYLIILCCIDSDVELAFYEKFGKSIRHLKGKVVFITGASSGIGKCIALALSKHGVKLVLAARRHEMLEEVKAECIANSGGQLTTNDVLVLPMDILDMASHKIKFDLALSHFGQIDILLNNAGRSQRALWETIDLFVDKELFELNVFSVINLTRIAVKYFNTRGHGHVAVTSSLAGIIPAPLSASYTGSKHAIHGYFNSLRLEKLSTNSKLTVTLLCPGPTFSNFLQESFTNIPGEKYGVHMQSSDRRMSGERCGYLCAVALANETKESWMSINPLLLLCYIMVYFPILSYLALKLIGPEKCFKARDGHVDPKLTQVKKLA